MNIQTLLLLASEPCRSHTYILEMITKMMVYCSKTILLKLRQRRPFPAEREGVLGLHIHLC